MTCLTGGCKFTKLDLSAAYQQMLLDPESCLYVSINTQRGLYRYLRLPFGGILSPRSFSESDGHHPSGALPCYLLPR